MKSPFNLPLIVQFGRDVWTVDDLEELNTVAKEWRWIFLPPTTGSNEWKLSYLDGSKAYDSEESADRDSTGFWSAPVSFTKPKKLELIENS
jgi:hypothetical protein